MEIEKKQQQIVGEKWRQIVAMAHSGKKTKNNKVHAFLKLYKTKQTS